MANLEFHISTNVQQAVADLEAFLQQIQKLQATLRSPMQLKISGLEDVVKTMQEIAKSLRQVTKAKQLRLFPEQEKVEAKITLKAEDIQKPFSQLIREQKIPRYREITYEKKPPTAREQRIRYYEMREQILGTFMQLYALRNFGRFFEGVGTALDRFRQDLVNTGLAVGENMVRVAAVTGMSANQMDRFAATVGKISAQAFLQPQQAMEVAYLVATRGIQDRSALETAIRSIGQFAFMTRADPAQAARSLLTAFFTVNLGKPMDQIVAMMQSEFPRVTNLLYSAYTRSPLEAQTILDALKYIGPAYGVTGRPFTELISTMMAAAQVIPQGGLLGRHLRSFLVFLSNPERIARAMQIVGKPTDVVGTISQLGLPQFLRQLSALLRNLSPEQQLQFWHTAVGLRAAPLAIVMTKMVDQIATYAETLANETANSLQKAIENIRSTPFGRLQTLSIEIQETKRQLSEAAMEAEIMMKQMQLRLLKMFASLPEGLQTSLFMLGKGAEMVGKGIGMFTDILSAALMWQLLRGLGKSPAAFLLKGAGIAGTLATSFTIIIGAIAETNKFLDNMKNLVGDAENYRFITPDYVQALEQQSKGYRYLVRHKMWQNFLGPIDWALQLGGVIEANIRKEKLDETFRKIDEQMANVLQDEFKDLYFYHGTEMNRVIEGLKTGGDLSRKIIGMTKLFLKSAGFAEMSDADIAQYVAGMAIDQSFLLKILQAEAKKFKEAGLPVPENLQGAINHAKEFAGKIAQLVDELIKQIQKTQDKMAEIDKLAGGKPIDVTQFDRYLKFLGIFKIPPGPSIWGDLPIPLQAPIKVVYDHSATNLLTAAKELKDASRQQWQNALGFNPNVYAPPVVVYEY